MRSGALAAKPTDKELDKGRVEKTVVRRYRAGQAPAWAEQQQQAQAPAAAAQADALAAQVQRTAIAAPVIMRRAEDPRLARLAAQRQVRGPEIVRRRQRTPESGGDDDAGPSGGEGGGGSPRRRRPSSGGGGEQEEEEEEEAAAADEEAGGHLRRRQREREREASGSGSGDEEGEGQQQEEEDDEEEAQRRREALRERCAPRRRGGGAPSTPCGNSWHEWRACVACTVCAARCDARDLGCRRRSRLSLPARSRVTAANPSQCARVPLPPCPAGCGRSSSSGSRS